MRPGQVFGLVRWASNDYGTIRSTLDIVRAVDGHEPCTPVPQVDPGGEVLLSVHGWPKVAQVFRLIDAIEASGIDPARSRPIIGGTSTTGWRARSAARLQPRAPSRLAPAQGAAAMIRRRFLLAGVVAAATLATLTVPVSRYAVWNATASVPTGLYAIRGKASLHVGERVAIEPPRELRRLLAERHYLPTGVPLIKRIAAVRGQRVCRFGAWHHHRRPICRRGACARPSGPPAARLGGCHVLRTGELFVMNPAAPDSFDGRYFGVLRRPM
jgi:type IV secretory pathway protease TraF